jgi:glycerophosphoryl diester phosphodiesterase
MITIPTLEEVLLRYPGFPKSIEIKDTGKWGRTSARRIKELHDKYLFGDLVVISSFDDATIKYFRNIMEGQLYTTAATKESGKFSVFSMIFLDPMIYPRYEAYHLPFEYKNFNLGRKRIVNAAHRSNVAMHYWTVNDSLKMIELLNIGADGIITDRPDILINILNSNP